MKLVFVSNFLNHHQIPLCETFKKTCDEFYFIKTSAIKGEAFVVSTEADYVLDYCDTTKTELIEKLVKESDCVIFGACPQHLIDIRNHNEKLSFLYAERYLKRGLWRRFFPKVKNAVKSKTPRAMKILCASAYLPYDLRLLSRQNDCFRWGYFPQVKRYEDINSILDKKKKNSILWAGRLIPLKHPEYAVKMAKKLKDKGYDFELNFVGDGEMKSQLEEMINTFNLNDTVHLLGKKTPDEVREIMEKSQIFLFTSNRREGWGAVMNESMNSGCTVVASHVIGSAPILIEDGKNGLLFKDGSVKSLTTKVERLLKDKDECRSLGYNAYNFITSTYNAETAGKRLIEFSKAILSGEEITYKDGPMSKAKILKDNWYKG